MTDILIRRKNISQNCNHFDAGQYISYLLLPELATSVTDTVLPQEEILMKTLKLTLAAAALGALVTLPVTSAHAWGNFGGPGYGGNNWGNNWMGDGWGDGYGDGDFDGDFGFNMSGSGRGRGSGYGRGYGRGYGDYYGRGYGYGGYGPGYGYGGGYPGYGYAPYGYAPPAAPAAPAAPATAQ